MPRHLRPTAPIASDAVLTGDPGRALLLAQELLEQPKMSNHARGLWGYSGRTPAGEELTIQSTGIGGPSAAVVLTDLAELGMRRAVRVGTCLGLRADLELGDVVVISRALAAGGSAEPHGLGTGDEIAPDPDLTAALSNALGEAAGPVVVASFDVHPGETELMPMEAAVADMQTAPLFARARSLGVYAAAVLVVTEKSGHGEEKMLSGGALEGAEKRAGRAAEGVLSG
jgi:purine-nucleoside phosphorylase